MEQLSDQDLEIIAQVRFILGDEANWTRYAPARNAEGLQVKPSDPRACTWCIEGALAYVAPGGLIPYTLLRHIDAAAREFLPMYVVDMDWTVSELNDELFDHEMLVQFLDFLLR